MNCPRCRKPIDGPLYGPCEPCRLELRATAHVPVPLAPEPEVGETIVRAAEAVVRRLVRESPSPGVPCRFCDEPVHGIHEAAGAHPCCAYWMGEQQRPYCVACAESKKARRERLERHKRDHRGNPDSMCEHCRATKTKAAA